MDFTTEPRIAAFFATHRSPAGLGNQEYSCIICVNTHELQDFWSSIARVRPDWPEPRRVGVDVSELWRLQAQRGIFLFLPYEDFERIYDFDRIYFPAQSSIPLIPEEDVYPKQKSDLEILLDQYFMLERMAEGDQILAETIDKFAVRVQAEGLPEGIEKACFGKAGLPVLNSWSEVNLQAWREPTPERWSEYSKAPRVGIELPPLEDPAKQLSRMARTLTEQLMTQPELRKGPVIWRCGGEVFVEESLRLFWDGARRWPYKDEDLATGLSLVAVFALLVSRSPRAQHYPHIAEELATCCLGHVIEVEIGMIDGSYTRGYARRSDLARAVRTDFTQYLNDEWRPQITKIQHVLQIATVPSRVFNFDPLATVFIQQVVPTQVVLRGESSGKARLYSIARAASLALP
jgi:hypothetical protein